MCPDCLDRSCRDRSCHVLTSEACIVVFRSITDHLWSQQDDETSVKTVDDREVSSRLQMVKALQMRALVAPPPIRPHASTLPKAKVTTLPGKANGTSGPGGGAGGGKKLCAECSKPLSGLPLRCSGCKVTYYCSKDCQKNAWPAHKESCKASSGGAAGASPATSPDGKAAAETAGSSKPTVEVPAVTIHGGPSMQEALQNVLAEAAAGNTDRLESLFETSVLSFLRGDYRGAITQVRQKRGRHHAAEAEN